MILKELIHLDCKLIVKDGLRIGGGGGEMEIGGVIDANLAAIRNPITAEPYLPGSSIKGKLRSMAEQVFGSFAMKKDERTKAFKREQTFSGDLCRCGQPDCRICPLFGAHMNPKAASAPTRITIRDAHFSDAYQPRYEEFILKTGRYLEEKTENVVNRKTHTAEHPRTGERIPPGAEFQINVVIRIYDIDQRPDAKGVRQDEQFLDTLERALGILQEADSLGASGSRGYGQVGFEDLRIRRVPVDTIALRFPVAQ